MDFADAYKRQVWTAHHWQHWLARGQFPDHPWRGYLQRSALTLKGLTYAPTGAIAAAGSTSLPETPGATATMTTGSPGSATPHLPYGVCTHWVCWEAVDFFAFIADLVEGEDDIQIMYGIGGEKELIEHDSTTCRDMPTRVRCGSERRVRAEAARCLGCAARLRLPSLQGSQPPGQPHLGDLGQAGQRGVEVLA